MMREKILIFKTVIRNMVKEILKKRDFDEDALIVAKAAMMIRNYLFNHPGFKFTGSLLTNCQQHVTAQ